ncbi:unnamed protein product, partial [Phaeothamnion confervicola]
MDVSAKLAALKRKAWDPHSKATTEATNEQSASSEAGSASSRSPISKTRKKPSSPILAVEDASSHSISSATVRQQEGSSLTRAGEPQAGNAKKKKKSNFSEFHASSDEEDENDRGDGGGGRGTSGRSAAGKCSGSTSGTASTQSRRPSDDSGATAMALERQHEKEARPWRHGDPEANDDELRGHRRSDGGSALTYPPLSDRKSCGGRQGVGVGSACSGGDDIRCGGGSDGIRSGGDDSSDGQHGSSSGNGRDTGGGTESGGRVGGASTAATAATPPPRGAKSVRQRRAAKGKGPAKPAVAVAAPPPKQPKIPELASRKGGGGSTGHAVNDNSDTNGPFPESSGSGGGGEDVDVGEMEDDSNDGSGCSAAASSFYSFGAFTSPGDRPAFPGRRFAGPNEAFDLGGGGGCIPRPLNRHLTDLQRKGVTFLWRCYADNDKGPLGGILLGDKGLGNMVQMIAFFSAVLKKTGTAADADRIDKLIAAGRLPDTVRGSAATKAPPRPLLLVCPVAALDSWLKHLEEWGRFSVAPLRSKKLLESVLARAACGRVEIVTTTYSMLQRHDDELRKVLWHVVVFDELHTVKDPKTKVGARARALRRDCTFGLSAAPISDHVEEWYDTRRDGLTAVELKGLKTELLELWEQSSITVPGLLLRWDSFKEYYAEPIAEGRSRKAGPDARRLCGEREKELAPLLSKLMFGRNRSETAAAEELLPGKNDVVVFCTLSRLQLATYKTILKMPDVIKMVRAHEKCDCGRGFPRGRCCHDVPSEHQMNEAVLWRQRHPDGVGCPAGDGGEPECPWCVCLPALGKLQKVLNHPCLLQVVHMSACGEIL